MAWPVYISFSFAQRRYIFIVIKWKQFFYIHKKSFFQFFGILVWRHSSHWESFPIFPIWGLMENHTIVSFFWGDYYYYKSFVLSNILPYIHFILKTLWFGIMSIINRKTFYTLQTFHFKNVVIRKHSKYHSISDSNISF